jgi:hypothetical protein
MKDIKEKDIKEKILNQLGNGISEIKKTRKMLSEVPLSHTIQVWFEDELLHIIEDIEGLQYSFKHFYHSEIEEHKPIKIVIKE